MPNTATADATRPVGLTDALVLPGRIIYSIAIMGLGIETLVVARVLAHPLSPGYNGIPVLPWLPAIPLVTYPFGVIWILCGVGLLSQKWRRIAGYSLGGLFALFTLVNILPAYIGNPGDMGLRTVVLEPLSLACIAVLLPGEAAISGWLVRVCRYVIALAMIVFGVDHFLGLTFIASLLPGWIPAHAFWVAFFGVVFIAGGVSIGIGILDRWGAAGVGLMFGIWVVTLHLPRVLGLYGIPGAPRSPDEWSSLLIAVGIWGGMWALGRASSREA